jgi:hypothetical protein
MTEIVQPGLRANNSPACTGGEDAKKGVSSFLAATFITDRAVGHLLLMRSGGVSARHLPLAQRVSPSGAGCRASRPTNRDAHISRVSARRTGSCRTALPVRFDGRPRMSGTFRSWQVIRRRGPLCKRSRAYPNFHRDVGPQPSWAHLMIRDDTSGAFEPGNARWRLAKWFRSRRSTARTS